jgi:hypothetical protein
MFIVQRNLQRAQQEQAKAQTGVTASLRVYDWLTRQYQGRRADVAEKAWQRGFDDPVLLPSGHKLVTSRDAADFIARVQNKKSDRTRWQAAIRF